MNTYTRFVVQQTKYKQSKTEANASQNSLQKEITTLRDSTRSLQLKLRDMEVANDDFERQARNTTSSLEDLEQKYNQGIERSVMLEEEIKDIEQERENLRIETQRLRDELSDMKVEADIVQERLRLAENTIQRLHEQKPLGLSTETLRPPSPLSETSTSATTLSSPTTSTPPPILSEQAGLAPTPPSPPLSEASTTAKPTVPSTPAPARKKSIAIDANATPRPGFYSRPPRHSRGPSIPVNTSATGVSGRTTPSFSRRPPTSRPSLAPQPELPRSGSLYQLRSLRTKMQSLEQRVHTVRSKLPAPTATPPRASPRNASALGHHSNIIPPNITVRSNRKKSGTSTPSGIPGASESVSGTSSRQSISRLSFGVPSSGRPPSSLDNSRNIPSSRPSSRASVTSSAHSTSQLGRPASRTGARTPLQGHYPSSSISSVPRPRSSISGSYGHAHSASVSTTNTDNTDGSDGKDLSTPLPRRTTLGKDGLTGIPAPSGLPRRQSGGSALRRTSGVGLEGEMKPPPSRGGDGRSRKLSEVGETF